MSDTETVEQAPEVNASEVQAAATEATVAESATVDASTKTADELAPVAEAVEPKNLPWEPNTDMIEAGKQFVDRCMADGLTPHPRGVYQTMFAAYHG